MAVGVAYKYPAIVFETPRVNILDELPLIVNVPLPDNVNNGVDVPIATSPAELIRIFSFNPTFAVYTWNINPLWSPAPSLIEYKPV